MKKRIAMLGICSIALLTLVFRKEIQLIYKAWTLFEPSTIASHFRSMDRHFLTHKVVPSPHALSLRVQHQKLPKTYTFEQEERDLQQFLDQTWTTGLLVVREDTIVHETYALGQKASDQAMAWSLSKSFIATLLGIAMDEGLFSDLNAPMAYYAPSLKATAYADIAIQDVLEMSSGIAFDEDYSNPISDINLLGYFMALGWPMDLYMKTLKPETPPGESFRYMSPNTQALAMLLRDVTQKPIYQYFEQKLWHPMGAEHEAFWIRDRSGIDLALGGLNASLRDLAKLGLLYLHQGKLHDKQILSPSWIYASTHTQKSQLKPRTEPRPSSWGYGYHWWLPFANQDDDDYCAIGIYGEFIYVNPRHRIVIAKTSAYPDYNRDGELREVETIAAFRTIARQISPKLPDAPNLSLNRRQNPKLMAK